MKGIDISHYNGSIDFKSVKNDGVELVYIKATEGTTYKDVNLLTNYNGAINEGLKIGFYHFLVGTSIPETQAENFYNNIKDKQNYLKPCLDVEVNNFDVMEYTLRFIGKFEVLSNLPLCIYTGGYFANDNLDSRLAKYPLWIAHYGVETPMQTNVRGESYVGHQYTESGRVNGISGNVDLNNFFDEILISETKGYIVTNYLPNGYKGNRSFQGVDIEYVLSYFDEVRCYIRGNSKGVWIETQMLPMSKCLELKNKLGSWFYSIES
jgi:GH25 family lysozyme M1 (1,4-beta-N-acetylmuramidase)